MNIKLLLITFNLLLCVTRQRQADVKYDAVESSNIYITNGLKKFNSLGSPKQLVKTFGKATVAKLNDEVLDGVSYDYKYNGLEVYFNNNKYDAITITKPNYQVYFNGFKVKVGENIETLKKHFPNSYKYRSTDVKRGALHLNMKYHGELVDAYIAILADKKGLITEISIANDNS